MPVPARFLLALRPALASAGLRMTTRGAQQEAWMAAGMAAFALRCAGRRTARKKQPPSHRALGMDVRYSSFRHRRTDRGGCDFLKLRWV